jgi:hypothetical protein
MAKTIRFTLNGEPVSVTTEGDRFGCQAQRFGVFQVSPLEIVKSLGLGLMYRCHRSKNE